MAKLTSKARNSMPKSEFGLPGKKAYPMPDKAHAANAKARATQQVKAGNLSPSLESQDRRKGQPRAWQEQIPIIVFQSQSEN